MLCYEDGTAVEPRTAARLIENGIDPQTLASEDAGFAKLERLRFGAMYGYCSPCVGCASACETPCAEKWERQ